MIAVSVIVPIHNSKKYIKECLDSIIQQTLSDIEILCIDSSTDGTTDILYNYQDIDNRVIVIEDKNSSYGYKMNLGIKCAKGEYIAIVESDDYIENNMLEILYHIAYKQRLDFVKGNYEGFVDTQYERIFGCWNRMQDEYYNQIINLREEKNFIPYVGYNIWSGIYNTEFLKKRGILFHESKGASYQDIGFACLTAMLGEKICFVKDRFYKYRMDNEGSSISSDQKYKCVSEEFAWLWDRMGRLGCNTEANIVHFNISKMNSYFWNYRRLSDNYKQKLLKELRKKELKDFDESVLDYRIPDKQHILKIYEGNVKEIEKEIEIEKEKRIRYTKLLQVFCDYEEIVLVCAGKYGQLIYTLMKLAECSFKVTICDNYMQGEEFTWDGKKIISLEEAVAQNRERYFIVANSKNGNEIKNQILSLGVCKDNIYVCNYMEPSLELFQNFNKYSRK